MLYVVLFPALDSLIKIKLVFSYLICLPKTITKSLRKNVDNLTVSMSRLPYGGVESYRTKTEF